ncbi:MAG TPA: sialidase family protein [Candidatus Paceibacterota bacterium]|nr:sialidase family protein [Candidatus Paceibacterota bacterium]
MKLSCQMRQKLPVVLVAGLGGFFTVVDVACAQPWAATTAPDRAWKAVATSADGTRLVAAGDARHIVGVYNIPGPPAPIYVSADAGATWTQASAPSNTWSSVACSADGARLVAATAPAYPPGGDSALFVDGLIYTSPDWGVTWTPTSAPSNSWSFVASSADGTQLVAVAAVDPKYGGDGSVYASSNSGVTWTKTSAPSNNWTSIASSADGARLVAVAAPYWDWHSQNYVGEGAIYRSLDSGASWTQNSAPTNYWQSVASSADGTKLVAVVGDQRGSISG